LEKKDSSGRHTSRVEWSAQTEVRRNAATIPDTRANAPGLR